MSRVRHADKHIERTLSYAETLGWRVEKAAGGHAHAWGRLRCPDGTRDGCTVYVYSTPRNPENHARQIRRQVDTCPHQPRAEPPPGEGDNDRGRLRL